MIFSFEPININQKKNEKISKKGRINKIKNITRAIESIIGQVKFLNIEIWINLEIIFKINGIYKRITPR